MTSSEDLALSFILPTRNRRGYIERALKSCLQVHQNGIRVEVLLVDGNSTDGSFEELQRIYGRDPRVRLVRQEGDPGFMPACFFAVPQVRTPFATFMYDDDILSPFWVDLARLLNRPDLAFAMAMGQVNDVTRTLEFAPVRQRFPVSPASVLRSYCECGPRYGPLGLPYSPICCLTRAEWLRAWMLEVKQFTTGHPIREYFLMQRNAGPDLMIYLFSLLQCLVGTKRDIALLDGAVAQFSAHPESMTIQFEQTDIEIGYWLPRVWLCDALRQRRQYAEAGLCGAFTAKAGLHLLRRRLRQGTKPWARELMREIRGLTGRLLAGPSVFSFARTLAVFCLPRRWRPTLNLAVAPVRL